MDPYTGDEIVISGIGGHFPECDNLDELKTNLYAGIDMVTEGRPRWEPGELNVPIRTGKMKSLEKCDAQYFGLIGKQCHALDPITRKVLERTYEAIFDAGLNPAELAGSKTGVFFGTSILETEMSLMETKSSDAYNILGRNKTMNANRISYCLDLKGPSFALDSTSSSGLQAFALGFQYIQSGLCEAALVGAGSSIIHSQFSKHFSDLKILSPDGVSRPFDDKANGCVRAEAVVVILLQKLKNAKRNYGIVLNAVGLSMSHSPGRILIPKREHWFELYQKFYSDCSISPYDVTFLEADGLACPDADSAELNAVCDFFCRERDPSKPLLIGSVKSNIGHVMAPAGLCSIAKILITNQTGLIPPNLNFNLPNKAITGLLTGKMKIVNEVTKLEGNLVAVNSFGFGGTYGHCLIKRPCPIIREPQQSFVPRLVLASARNEEGLEAILNKIEEFDESEECLQLIDDLFARNIAHHMCRGYTILQEKELRASNSFQGDKRPVWFIFSGMGSHWATMGKDLSRLPVFRKSIDQCHRILKTKNLDLWNILTEDNNAMFDNILNSFVGISSIQIALVDILSSIGIKPDGIIGHSAGELAAAYADGCLSLEETILSSYSRGKVSTEVKVIKGVMAAVGKGCSEMEKILPEDVEVACHNSPTNCTISGPCEKVNTFVKKLQDEGVFVKVVNVSNIAFHSKHIKDLGPKLNEELTKIILHPRKRSSRWISSSVPENKWKEPEWNVCSAEYLTNNLLSPVYFEEACRHIPKNAIVIEIAPHSLLLSVLKRSLNKDCINIGLTHRNAPDQLVHLLQMFGKLYMIGLQPRIGVLYPKVELPVPLGTPFLGNFATWDHSFSWKSEIKADSVSNKSSRNFVLYLEDSSLYKSFKLQDRLTLPYSVFIMLVLEVYSSVKKMEPFEMRVSLKDIVFKKLIALDKRRSISLTVTILSGLGKFEILNDKEEVIVCGVVKENSSKDIEWKNPKYLDLLRLDQCLVEGEVAYSELSQSGYDYQKPLRGLKTIARDENSSESYVEWNGDLAVLIESLIQTRLISFSDLQRLRELKIIGELVIEPSLFLSDEGIRLHLNLKTDIIHGKGIALKRAKFKVAERCESSLPLIGHMEPKCYYTPKANALVKFSFAEFFAGNMKWDLAGYSGIDSSNGKVMGLARYDPVTSSLEPDLILSWKVPNTWHLEQAATVPISYSLAYYMMKILTDLRDYDTVLITNGTSPIGMACTTVALQYTKEVFITVSSRQEEQFFIKKFCQLKENVITFDPEKDDGLLLENVTIRTKKKGVTYFISTCPGTSIENYLDCVTNFSHLFQIFLQETEEGYQFSGTINLIKSSSIYGVTAKSLLFSRDSDKMIIKDFVSCGIKSGLIIPFPARLISHHQLQENCERIVGKESQIVKMETDECNPRFICKKESTYLVISKRLCVGLLAVEWFAKRQAKNIVLIHSDRIVSRSNEKKIIDIRQYTPLTVKQTGSFRETVFENLINKISNVDAVVLFPIDEEEDRDFSYTVLKFLDSNCLERNGRIVCFLKSNSRAIDLCIERSRSGKPTSAVISDKSLHTKWRQFLEIFDILLDGNGNEGIIRLKDENEGENFLEKDMGEFLNSLPKNEDEVAEYGRMLSKKVKLTEIKTLSLPFESVVETLPVFLVEGIGRSGHLVDRFRDSFYPTFKVELPHLGCATIHELASYVIPKIKCITEGPYILIGEQWGGCVALELARQLENLGGKTHVFLLSGTPLEVIEPLRHVATVNEPLEVSLISRLLQITNEKVLQELSNERNWKGKMDYCLQYVKEPFRRNVREGLDAIKSRLEALINYSLENPLNGRLTIITKRKIPPEHYKYMCRKRVILYEVKEEENLISDEIFRMIHDTIIHKTI